MNVTIIGAGNMGGAIARGLLASADTDVIVTVTNPSVSKLERIKTDFPNANVTTDNIVGVKDADVVILAVKPWILPDVVAELKNVTLPHTIVSIVAGVTVNDLLSMFGDDKALFRVIPDTAIMVGEGMTFVSHNVSDDRSVDDVCRIFASMGRVAVIEERLMAAATALSSCGIAYAYKYIQACVQAGVQLGFRPAEAQRYAVATVKGAMAMLDAGNNTSPQAEIDRVTTPGGMTIRGINALERSGFTASVIDAILVPLKK